MKYTFEFTIAGCATNCAHCYVDGGPAPQMKLDDYKYCVQKTKSILDKLDGDVAVTIGNEMFFHSAINEILDYNVRYLADYFSFRNYPVPTTGIAIVNRSDRDKIIKNLRNVGANGCMLAIHGAEQSHNETVGRLNAYSKLFEAADYFYERKFGVRFNLIVSKTLCMDFEQVMQRISYYPKAETVLTVPNYVPTKRMRMYQSRRAEYEDCIGLAKKATVYSIDTDNLLLHSNKHNENTVISELNQKGFDYSAEKQNSVKWKFFNITQNGDLYFGNVGAHTKWIGNLFYTAEDKILEEVLVSEPNYDYIAYYADTVFLSLEKHISMLPQRKHNYVYCSKQDCIYALLDEIGVQNALI